MKPSIPFVDLQWMHAHIAAEVLSGWKQVVATTSFAGGEDVTAFESEFARASGRQSCVGVANGTDAIELALRALGVGRGDEVIIPANTFIATAEAVMRAGATPSLVDADRDTLLMDPSGLDAAVGPRTAAIVPVHLYGQIAPMAPILAIAEARGLAVVEDAAQAQGATQHGRGIGSGSAAAATSFYPGKNLGAYGDAGAIVTDSADLERRLRLLANHGSLRKYDHEALGFNSRLDTLQAVVLRAKLARLDGWNALRRQAAARYSELLGGLDLVLPVTAPGNEHVWHLYVIRVGAHLRDGVLAALGDAGIGAGIHYPRPIHQHAAFGNEDFARGSFPISEAAATEMISLPMHPGLSEPAQQRVAEALRTVVPPRP